MSNLIEAANAAQSMGFSRSIIVRSWLRTLQVTALAMPMFAHRSAPNIAAALALPSLHVRLRTAARQLALLWLTALFRL